MNDDGAVLFLGVVLGFVAAVLIWGSITDSAINARWCRRIAASEMPTTFAECLHKATEVPKDAIKVQD